MHALLCQHVIQQLNACATNCLCDKLSMRRNVLQRIVLQRIVYATNCPATNCPCNELSATNCPRRIVLRRIVLVPFWIYLRTRRKVDMHINTTTTTILSHLVVSYGLLLSQCTIDSDSDYIWITSSQITYLLRMSFRCYK